METPDIATEPGLRFFREQNQIWRFNMYIVLMVETNNMLKERLVESYKTVLKENKEVEEIFEEWSRKTKEITGDLQDFRQWLFEMMLCRAVDNYLAYISELIALIFRTKPETLISNDTVTVEMIFKHESLDELAETIAEERVNELSFQGIGALSEYLSKKLGFGLYETNDARDNAVRIVTYRNVIVHNRGIINRIAASRMPNLSGRIGEPIDFAHEPAMNDVAFLMTSVCDIDKRAAEKFALNTSALAESDRPLYFPCTLPPEAR